MMHVALWYIMIYHLHLWMYEQKIFTIHPSCIFAFFCFKRLVPFSIPVSTFTHTRLCFVDDRFVFSLLQSLECAWWSDLQEMDEGRLVWGRGVSVGVVPGFRVGVFALGAKRRIFFYTSTIWKRHLSWWDKKMGVGLPEASSQLHVTKPGPVHSHLLREGEWKAYYPALLYIHEPAVCLRGTVSLGNPGSALSLSLSLAQHIKPSA